MYVCDFTSEDYSHRQELDVKLPVWFYRRIQLIDINMVRENERYENPIYNNVESMNRSVEELRDKIAYHETLFESLHNQINVMNVNIIELR